MLNFTKGNTEFIYFTGTEKAALPDPYFLFIFTNRVTKEVVKKMVINVSTTGRYDKGSIIVNNSFSGKDEGFWDYQVIEKTDVNDLTVTGNVVEEGFMYLRTAVPFAPVEYNEQLNTFKTYNGE